MRGFFGVVAGVVTMLVTWVVIAACALYASPCEGPDCGSSWWPDALVPATAIVAGVLVGRNVVRRGCAPQS